MKRPALSALCALLAALSSFAAPAPDPLPDTPFPAAEGSDAVLLRYVFPAGRSIGFKADMSSTTVVTQQDARMEIAMNFLFEGRYRFRKTMPDGSGDMEFRFTRLRMEMNWPQTMIADTKRGAGRDDPTSKTVAEGLAPFIGPSFSFRMSPRGQLLGCNMDLIVAAFAASASPEMAAQIAAQTKTLIEKSFIPLPEKPVRRGEVYPAGRIENAGDGAAIAMDVEYKVLSVSADGQFVILQPVVRISSTDPATELKSSDLNGWILYDARKGFPSRSKAYTKLVLSMNGIPAEVEATVGCVFK